VRRLQTFPPSPQNGRFEPEQSLVVGDRDGKKCLVPVVPETAWGLFSSHFRLNEMGDVDGFDSL